MIGQSYDMKLCQPGEDLMREFLTNPICIDNGGNLCLQEVPNPAQQSLVLLAQSRTNSVEIAIGLRKCLCGRNTHTCFLLIDGPLTTKFGSRLLSFGQSVVVRANISDER